MVVPPPITPLETALQFVRRHNLHQTDAEVAKLVRKLEIIRFPSVSRTRAEEQLIAKVKRVQQGLEECPFALAPVSHISTGEIILGSQVRDGLPVRYPAHRLLTHVLLPGSSGTGKSTLIGNIVYQTRCLPQPPRLVVPDTKDDARRWPVLYPDFVSLEHDTPFNVLDVPFIPPEAFRALFAQILGAGMWMGHRQGGLLSEGLRRAFATHQTPSLEDLYQAILGITFPKITFSQIDDKDRILHRLHLVRDAFPVGFRTRKGIPIATLLRHHSIYLPILHQTKVEEWLFTLLMHYAFNLERRASNRDQLSRIAVVDEAILSWAEKADTIGGSPLLQDLLPQLREWSTAMIASTTSLKLTSTLLKNNAGLAICTHNVAELDDIRRLMNLTPQQADWMARRLQLGQAVMRWSEAWKEPILIQFPIMTPHGGPPEKSVTKSEWDEVRQRVQQLIPTDSEPVTVTTLTATVVPRPDAAPDTLPSNTKHTGQPARSSAGHSGRPPIALNAQQRAWLDAIVAMPLRLFSEYRHALGDMHPQTSARAVGLLERLRLVESARVTVGRGRGQTGRTYRPTAAGCALSGKRWHGCRGGSGLQHDSLVHAFARCPALVGNSIETTIGSKSIDLILPYRRDIRQAFCDGVQRCGIALPPLHDGDVIAIECEVSDPVASGIRNAVDCSVGCAFCILAVLKLTTTIREKIQTHLPANVVIVDALHLLEELQ